MIKKRKFKIYILFVSLFALVGLFFIPISASIQFENLITYSAISAYYSNSTVFISTNGGQSYSSVMGQDVSTSIVDGNLRVDKSNPWNGSALYYINISFSSPFNLKQVSFFGNNRPNPTSLVTNDVIFGEWVYGYIDGTSYLYINNIFYYSDSIDIYFTINGYTNGNNKYFDILVTGFNTGIDSYNDGFNDGYNVGYTDGQSVGYTDGYNAGYSAGLAYAHDHVDVSSASYSAGVATNSGYNAGYSAGYVVGYSDGENITDTNTQANGLLWTIAGTPWESFKHIWNVNVLGINIANVITGFITAIILIWIIKKFWK